MFWKKREKDDRIDELERTVEKLKRDVSCLQGEHDWHSRTSYGFRPSSPANRICENCLAEAKITESRKVEITKNPRTGV